MARTRHPYHFLSTFLEWHYVALNYREGTPTYQPDLYGPLICQTIILSGMEFILQQGIAGLITTGRIEKVVAPIVRELLRVFLLGETRESAEQFPCVEEAAQQVGDATRNMAVVASRLVEELSDDVMRKEMEVAVLAVTASGQHLLLAAQKLNIEPCDTEHKEELCTSAQNVLLGVLKVLLLEDDDTMRKITSAALRLLYCLTHLEEASNLQSLLKTFQDFSDALLLLNKLTSKRTEDLLDPSQQEHMANLLETLKKCVSMLHTALLTAVKHPHSKEADAAKKYILGRVHTTIVHLLSCLKNDCCGNISCQRQSYRAKLEGLLKILAVSRCQGSSYNSLLNDIILYCMVVAKSSRNKFKKLIMDNCQDVLQLWCEILQKFRLSEDPSNCKQPVQYEIDDSFILLKSQLEKLDHSISTTVLYQVLDEFIPAKVPFDDVLHDVGKALNSDSDGRLKTLQAVLSAFLSHTDQMLRVAGFVAALSADVKVLKNVENSTECLKRLKATVTSYLLELERSCDCPVALRKLQDLCHQWVEESSFLIDALCDIISVIELTSITVQELENERCNCQKAFELKHPCQFQKCALKLVGCMNLVLQSVRRHINKSDNPVYRNGLLVFIKQGETSVAEVTASMRHVLDQGLDIQSFTTFSDNASVAYEQLHVLTNGLKGLQHPHLLSSLREEVRQPSTVLSALHTQHLENPSKGENQTAHILANGVTDRNPPTQFFAKPLEEDSSNPLTLSIRGGKQTELAIIYDIRQPQTDEDFGLLPPLKKVLKAAKEQDKTAVNIACTDILEISNCYTKAVKMAMDEPDTATNQKLEKFRSEVVTLTLKTVQTAQEIATNSIMSTERICKEAVLLSDRIRNLRQLLIPFAGTWYHAICAVFQAWPETTTVIKTQQVKEVMRSCTHLIQLVALSDLAMRDKHQGCFAILHSKLKESQDSAKHLVEVALSLSSGPEELEGPCFLWALSIQTLLNSVDRMLGVTIQEGKTQFTLDKRLAVILENSLRIQEASRLSSLICTNKNTVKVMRDLDQEVRSVTEAYLKAAHELCAAPFSDIIQLSTTEILQRQLQVKVNALSGLVSTVNKEYTDAIQSVIKLAVSGSTNNREDRISEAARMHSGKLAELLLRNVKIATQKVQDCLHFVKDPTVRISLKFTSEHLCSQMSDIVRRVRKINESHSTSELLSLEVQVQCWSAKAHFLVQEICNVEGLHWRTQEHVRLGLQGKEPWDTCAGPSAVQPEETYPSTSTLVSSKKNTEQNMKNSEQKTNPAENVNNPEQETLVAADEHPKLGLRLHTVSRSAPSLTYTSLFLKRETDKWDAQNNHVVQVTREMAGKIYHMAQYLRRKGPIQNKEAFVNTAKDMVSDCQLLIPFVRVIADHCLDKQCREDLIHTIEQIHTITSQLAIISRVNAVTPGTKSSNEILVKNAQNLLHVVIQAIKAAETACIKGLRQPDPDSDGAEAAALCLQWRRNLLIHRAQQNSTLAMDDLGLRKTSQIMDPPSLVAPIHMKEVF